MSTYTPEEFAAADAELDKVMEEHTAADHHGGALKAAWDMNDKLRAALRAQILVSLRAMAKLQEGAIASLGDLVGHVDVDAGIVMIGDPCYTLGDGSSAPASWSEFVDATFKPENIVNKAGVAMPLEHKGAGIVIPSGYGDGSYPVYVNTNSEGRVVSATVVFIGGDDEGFIHEVGGED